jgi:hypothetical protein
MIRQYDEAAWCTACGACGLEILLEEPFHPFGLRVGGWGFGDLWLILDSEAIAIYRDTESGQFEIELRPAYNYSYRPNGQMLKPENLWEITPLARTPTRDHEEQYMRHLEAPRDRGVWPSVP